MFGESESFDRTKLTQYANESSFGSIESDKGNMPVLESPIMSTPNYGIHFCLREPILKCRLILCAIPKD